MDIPAGTSHELGGELEISRPGFSCSSLAVSLALLLLVPGSKPESKQFVCNMFMNNKALSSQDLIPSYGRSLHKGLCEVTSALSTTAFFVSKENIYAVTVVYNFPCLV